MVIGKISNVLSSTKVSNVYLIVREDWVVGIYADKNVSRYAINYYVKKTSKLLLNVDTQSRVLVKLKNRINQKNANLNAYNK